MNTIKNDLVVEINYVLTNSTGQILSDSKVEGPLSYIHGNKTILPGLENGLTGKNIGDKLKVDLSAENAYGERDEKLIQLVDKKQFNGDIEVGAQFQMQSPDGSVIVATAIEVKENEVVLDSNHPLAGEAISFDVEILSLRAATSEELAQGSLTPKKAASSCSGTGCC